MPRWPGLLLAYVLVGAMAVVVTGLHVTLSSIPPSFDIAPPPLQTPTPATTSGPVNAVAEGLLPFLGRTSQFL